MRRLTQVGREASKAARIKAIREALAQVRGSIPDAAKLLGVARQNLYLAMDALGLEPDVERARAIAKHDKDVVQDATG